MIKKMTNEIIDNVLFSDKAFMILFYSQNTQNMDNIIKIFEGFDEKLQNKVDVYTCDIENQVGKLTNYFRMNTLPAMVIMKHNKPYANIAGPASATVYENSVKDAILKIMQDEKLIEENKKAYSAKYTPGGGYKTIQMSR